MSEERVSVRLLRRELESWVPFIDALRFEDRKVAREMMERCTRYVEAVEASGKEYVTEPFFLSVLLTQERQIAAFEGELEKLRGEVQAWKRPRDGS
ncbi:MAG: hypothetical protein OK456_01975 [Thaumarchaeota archaeon]|nr:hypothetical protein [Nitrososphaerota archaeon]